MCNVSFFFPARLVHKEISATFERLHSQVKSESCVFTVTGSPIIIWPNKDFHTIPEQITAQTLCKDIHQWIQWVHVVFDLCRGEIPAFYEFYSGSFLKCLFRKDDQDSAGKRSAKKKNKRNIEAVCIHFKVKHNFLHKHKQIVYSIINIMVVGMCGMGSDCIYTGNAQNWIMLINPL